MSGDKSRINGLLDKRVGISSSFAQPIFIINQTFINNFPAPKNPSRVEDSRPISSEIDPFFPLSFPRFPDSSPFQPISPEIDPSFFEEERAFLQMKDLLYEKYPEKYVAIKDGKVVDVDEDNSALAERVYKEPNVTVYINKVTREEEVACLVSPRTDE